MRKFGNKLIKPIPFTQGYNRESAKIIKKKVNVPIFAVGGMINPAFMEETIQSGKADYISLCRSLITYQIRTMLPREKNENYSILRNS